MCSLARTKKGLKNKKTKEKKAVWVNNMMFLLDSRDGYATPKVTKYQRCNYIIQIYKFTIKIDTININLLF